MFKNLKTPTYIIDESLLEKNAQKLNLVRSRTGAKILLALKAFSMFSIFPILKPYLDGTEASSLFEAQLGFEEFGPEVHIFSPAYHPKEFPKILKYANHISFNSFHQWQQFKPYFKKDPQKIAYIRINPQHSEVEVDCYNPCARYSRLGVTKQEFKEAELDGITGLHFHTLCQKNVDALERTLEVVIAKFGQYLSQMEWVNFGGGHHITRDDYDIDRLCDIINQFQSKYKVKVILEPGEAIALNAGFLVASVMDFVKNEKELAILDTSATAHMPDILEMPYRPEIIDAQLPNQSPYTYRLAGNTCLAGDIIGDYSFEAPLKIGQKLIFTDMAHYTMVKNNTFNGIALPSISLITKDKKIKTIKKFGYKDFKNRLS